MSRLESSGPSTRTISGLCRITQAHREVWRVLAVIPIAQNALEIVNAAGERIVKFQFRIVRRLAA